MFQIEEAQFVAPEIKRFRIVAPRIARKRQAGHFVIVRVHPAGERIPLTIADSDLERGTITLFVQGIGKTTRLMNMLNTGDCLSDVVGPLGKASEISKYGTVVVIGGGVGAAIAYPTVVAMKQAGNQVVSIVGARNRHLVILESEIGAFSDRLILTTDDGSYGRQGLVTAPLLEMIENGQTINLVLAIGPIPMMRAVAEVTRPYGIKTIVSLNSVMVDGTGMCGGCRVVVGDQSQFACVDGPEFDAHQVDFAILQQRNSMYRDAERISLQELEGSTPDQIEHLKHACRLESAYPEVANLRKQ